MTEEVRCPECGARNTAEAEWCTQCYTPLVVEEEPPAAAPAAAPQGAGGTAEPDGLLPLPPEAEATADDEDQPARTTPEAGSLRSGDGRFRETDQGLEWSCRTCDTWNSMDRLTCAACGTPFGPSLGVEAEPERPDVPPAALTVVSLALPGAGHWLLGLRVQAVVRALLGTVWGLGGFVLFLRGQMSGQSALPAIPLLFGWLVVAAGSANDAVVEGGGSGRVVLQGRVLMWLTLVVVGATFAAVLVGVLSAVGQ